MLRRVERSYPLDSLLGAEIETTEHTDGGTVYRPRLRFSTAENVPISMLWYQSAESSQKVVEHLNRFVNEAR